jgi:dethiobiotin synthetase
VQQFILSVVLIQKLGKLMPQVILPNFGPNKGSVLSQKLVQTGNVDVSEDIEKHREIMGVVGFRKIMKN